MTKYSALLTLLFLAACSASPRSDFLPLTPLASPRKPAAQQVIQNSPFPEQLQAATDTPGPDYAGTASAAQATADAANLVVAEYTAEYERDQEAAALRTETAYYIAVTKDAENRAAGGTAQAVRATQAVIEATRTADGMVMAARVPTIAAAMTQVQYVGQREGADILARGGIGIGAALLGLALLLYIAWGMYAHLTMPMPETPNIYDVPAPRPLERQVIERVDGSLDLDTLPPGSPAKFSAFASYALTGAPLGINKIEATKIYTRAEYAPVFRWLKKKMYLGPNDGGTGLSKNGEMFCALWIGNNPPSPTQENVQKQADNSHEHGNHEYGDGGGALKGSEPPSPTTVTGL